MASKSQLRIRNTRYPQVKNPQPLSQGEEHKMTSEEHKMTIEEHKRELKHQKALSDSLKLRMLAKRIISILDEAKEIMGDYPHQDTQWVSALEKSVNGAGVNINVSAHRVQNSVKPYSICFTRRKEGERFEILEQGQIGPNYSTMEEAKRALSSPEIEGEMNEFMNQKTEVKDGIVTATFLQKSVYRK